MSTHVIGIPPLEEPVSAVTCEIKIFMFWHRTLFDVSVFCSDPIFVIMEFVPHGKLQSFLRHSRAQRYYNNMHGSSDTLTSQDLTSFCYQISKGMQYLSSKGVSRTVWYFRPERILCNKSIYFHLRVVNMYLVKRFLKRVRRTITL